MLKAYFQKNQIDLQGDKGEMLYSLPFEVFEPVSLANNLAPFVQQNKLQSKAVELFLSEEDLYLKKILFKKRYSDWRLYRHLSTDFNRYFEGSSADFFLDFRPVEQGDAQIFEHWVNVVIAKKSKVAEYSAVLSCAGLVVQAVDVFEKSEESR